MSSETTESLRAARELLTDPTHWIKGSSARDENQQVPLEIRDAVCFCALGAIWRVAGIGQSWSAESILSSAVRSLTSFTNLVSFNDDPTTTHADVIRVFDHAIALAEAAWGDGR